MNIKGIIQKVWGKVAQVFGTIEYPINDPDVPLVVKSTIPQLPEPCPPFSVHGFTGQVGQPNSPETQGAIVYTTLVNAIDLVQKRAPAPLVSWPRTRSLIALPRAGVQFNAYYDGSSLRFFYNRNPKTNKVVFTCESSDVVSHELGHAILDAWRPDLWSTASLEIISFHESFGDMMAILAALWHDEIVEYVINETNSDMRKPNIVSKIAEEMGAAVYANLNRADTALRNAVNNFKYVPPEQLPRNASPDALSSEPHSFSRIFTGAFYDLLCWRFEANRQSQEPREALKAARDQIASVLFAAVPRAAASPKFFDAVVRAMIVADRNLGGQCVDGIVKIFTERLILQEIPLMARPTAFKMDGRDSKIFTHKYGSTVRVSGTKKLKLIDHMALVQSDNPLYAVEIDVPNEHYLEYDERGHLKVERPAVKEEVLAAAKACVDFLAATDRVSLEKTTEHEKEFSVVDSKLKRNFICCGCH